MDVMLENSSKNSRRVAVMGVGNILFGDEGVGVHVVNQLRDSGMVGEEVQLIDGGTSPDAVCRLDDVSKLIIVDAVKGGCEPGSIYRFTDAELETTVTIPSLHQLSMADSLNMLELMGDKPSSVVIIGVEPESMDCNLKLSPLLRQKVEDIKSIVMEEIKAD